MSIQCVFTSHLKRLRKGEAISKLFTCLQEITNSSLQGKGVSFSLISDTEGPPVAHIGRLTSQSNL